MVYRYMQALTAHACRKARNPKGSDTYQLRMKFCLVQVGRLVTGERFKVRNLERRDNLHCFSSYLSGRPFLSCHLVSTKSPICPNDATCLPLSGTFLLCRRCTDYKKRELNACRFGLPLTRGDRPVATAYLSNKKSCKEIEIAKGRSNSKHFHPIAHFSL
ncbi:hypothetical protein V8G54_014142 [Vigna mungo]|uniref:Uncharacterized protein n=1 Tax=Vigna mungo TaxID=3915 RepID=A0AAQ3NH47_VIGMU